MTPPDPPPPPTHGRQLHVPIFPAESTYLGERISVMKRDGSIWYFHYDMPVFSHAESDFASFRLFTSSLCDNGQCKLVDIERTFGVSAISVKRALKQFRTEGGKSFFISRRPKVRPRIMTDEKRQEVQQLLDKGCSPGVIEAQLKIKADTIRNAIEDGRLHRPKKGADSISQR